MQTPMDCSCLRAANKQSPVTLMLKKHSLSGRLRPLGFFWKVELCPGIVLSVFSFRAERKPECFVYPLHSGFR